MKKLLILALLSLSCNSTREFWNYVVEDGVEKPAANRESGTVDSQKVLSPHNVKVVYNDGQTTTEVIIPILASGQQIVLENNYDRNPAALSVIPPAPTPADAELEANYLKEGHAINRSTTPVSIIATHDKIKELTKSGNYGLALQYAEVVLKRYPNHVKTLQIKGSLLLKLGERKAALETYYKAQEIEPDARVKEQINKLEQTLK
ncbi:MAG: hypothetical protein AB7T49_13235 [Oligoflexales bacterium]